MKRTLFITATLCLMTFAVTAQEQKDKTGPEFHLEFIMDGLLNDAPVARGTNIDNLYGLMSTGWGTDVQASIIFDSGFGLLLRGSNDVLKVTNHRQPDELIDGQPKIIRQSIYQGITYIAPLNKNESFSFQASAFVGWSRFRMPEIKYKGGMSYRFYDVDGFATGLRASFLYQYGKRSMIKLGVSKTVDFVNYEFQFGDHVFRDDTELYFWGASLSHVTKF